MVFENLKKFEIESDEYSKYSQIVRCMSFYNFYNLKSKYEELNIYNYEQSSIKPLLEQNIIRVLGDNTYFYIGIDNIFRKTA